VHSDDGTGPGFQQLAPSNFIKINISCRLWAQAAPDTASDHPSPHISSLATEDHNDRWSPNSWIKWTQWTL